jgi:FkbM family methyltransferase
MPSITSKIIKSFIKMLLPTSLRHWYQKNKMEKLIAHFPKKVVEHHYGCTKLKIELADPLAKGWYDHDWDVLPEIKVLQDFGLQSGARVFDIGSHQGVVGLMLGKIVGETGNVIMIEPVAHNVKMCQRNIELNGMYWVAVREAAIAAQDGRIMFNNCWNGSAAVTSDYGGVREVEAISINSLAIQFGMPACVMIDVEGFECLALLGASDVLTKHVNWCVEVHVGCGLEASGGSVSQLLGFFPNDRFIKFIHSDGDKISIPFNDVSPEIMKKRFFLTAISK